jgi:hypothetical protein
MRRKLTGCYRPLLNTPRISEGFPVKSAVSRNRSNYKPYIVLVSFGSARCVPVHFFFYVPPQMKCHTLLRSSIFSKEGGSVVGWVGPWRHLGYGIPELPLAYSRAVCPLIQLDTSIHSCSL